MRSTDLIQKLIEQGADINLQLKIDSFNWTNPFKEADKLQDPTIKGLLDEAKAGLSSSAEFLSDPQAAADEGAAGLSSLVEPATTADLAGDAHHEGSDQ